jgi:hypothetical protein
MPVSFLQQSHEVRLVYGVGYVEVSMIIIEIHLRLASGCMRAKLNRLLVSVSGCLYCMRVEYSRYDLLI